MKGEHETWRILAALLQDGPTQLPDRVRADVASRLAATEQDRPWRARTHSLRDRLRGMRLAAAALVVILLADVTILSGPMAMIPEVGAPTVTPTTGATGRAVEPGTQFLKNPYSEMTFTLPAGWEARGSLFAKHLDQPNEVAFSVWTVGEVYDDPCDWRSSTLSPLDLTTHHVHVPAGEVIPVGASDGGLSNQLGRRASPLVGASLGGVYAMRIELSVPAALDLSSCDAGEYRSWTDWKVIDGANAHHVPGQVDVVYMVDVDRRPFVVDASYRPSSSATDKAELEEILGSMLIRY
jgi:hypothetical protein